MAGVTQAPYRAIAQALEVIPRTLAQNCGATVIRTLTALRAKHATGGSTWGINGETGELADMKDLGIWDPLAVKLQVLKTAVEVNLSPWLIIMLLLTNLHLYIHRLQFFCCASTTLSRDPKRRVPMQVVHLALQLNRLKNP